MSAAKTVRTYVGRFLELGWARVFMVLGVLFCLLALATPLWSVTFQEGPGHWDTSSYSWFGVNTDHFRQSVYDGSSYQPYSGPTFDQPALASAVGTSFALIAVLIIVLIFAIALYSTTFATRLPHLGLLVIALFVVIMALVALFAPLLIIPNAAAADFTATVFSSGFWGSSATPSATWGAGLGWWLLLIGVILGAVGGALPFLQRMRQPTVRAPPPREWQVER